MSSRYILEGLAFPPLDLDTAKVEEALRLLQDSGIRPSALDQFRQIYSANFCDQLGCSQVYHNSQGHLFYHPDWSNGGGTLGRPVKITEVRELLQPWQRRMSGQFCRECLFSYIPEYVSIIIAMPNATMKRFFKVYLKYIETLASAKATIYGDFHRTLVRNLFASLPAKHRRAFKDLSKIMEQLGLI